MLLLPQLPLLLKFPAQLLLGVSKLLPSLLNLGFTSSNGFLQRPGMLQSGLDKLILEVGGFIPLGLQVTLVLERQLFLFG